MSELYSENTQKIDQYTIISEIYTRNHIKLFKVVHNDKYYALKMIQKSAPEQNILEFRKEISILKKLTDINYIPSVSFVSEAYGNPYYIMDYITGISLKKYLQSKKFVDEVEALQIIKKIAEIVNQIHKKDIIHCDLSPANIMIVGKQVFIIDFGIALREQDMSKKTTKNFAGTLNYISPEQANGEYNKIGFWSDIYSIGAISYHLVTGRPPFAAENNIEIMHLLANNNLSPIEKYNPKISSQCQSIIYKALKNKIADRYTNVKDFLNDVSVITQNQVKKPIDNTVYPETLTMLPNLQSPKSKQPIYSISNTQYINYSHLDDIETNSEDAEQNLLFEDYKPSLSSYVPQQNLEHFLSNKPNANAEVPVADANTEKSIAEKPVIKPIRKRNNIIRQRSKNNNSRVFLLSFISGAAISVLILLPFLLDNNAEEADRTTNSNINVNSDSNSNSTNANSNSNTATNKIESKQNENSATDKFLGQNDNLKVWRIPTNITSFHQSKWVLKGDVWQGTCSEAFGLMVIQDFSSWQNYILKADIFIVEGQMGVFVRNFAQKAQFPNFLGQMGVINNQNQWYTVTAIANGSRISISVEGVNQKLSSVDNTLTNSGIAGFGIAPLLKNKPALVYVKNIRMQKLP